MLVFSVEVTQRGTAVAALREATRRLAIATGWEVAWYDARENFWRPVDAKGEPLFTWMWSDSWKKATDEYNAQLSRRLKQGLEDSDRLGTFLRGISEDPEGQTSAS
jgi:hypothetical protein